MGLAIDTTGGNSTDSQSVTLGSLTNGALYVVTMMRATASADRGVSSVSYGGNALTKVADYDNTAGSDRIRITIWRLLNPPNGSNTLAITPSGTPQSKVYGWVSLSGVDQTTPEDVIGTGATANSNAPTSSVTTIADNAYVIDAGLIDSSSATVSVGSGQTQIVNASNGNRRGFASYEGPKSPAGSVTMDWSASASAIWAAISIAIKPAGGTNVTVIPSVAAAAFSLVSAAVLLGATLSPTAQSLSFSISPSQVSTQAIVTPTTQALAITAQSPGIVIATAIQAGVQQVTTSGPSPTVTGGAVMRPTVQAVSVTGPAVTIRTDQILSSGVQSASLAVNAVTAMTGAIVAPATQATTFNFQTGSVQTGVACQVSVLLLTATVQSATVIVPVRVYPYTQKTRPYSTQPSPYGRQNPYRPLV